MDKHTKRLAGLADVCSDSLKTHDIVMATDIAEIEPYLRLTIKLLEYAGHLVYCDSLDRGYHDQCSCGWRELKAALDSMEEG